MDLDTTTTTDPILDPEQGQPRDPATGQFVTTEPTNPEADLLAPDTQAAPVAPAPAPTAPAAPATNEDTPESLAAELAKTKESLKFYQTGYQKFAQAAPTELRDEVKAQLATRYGTTAKAPAATQGQEELDPFSPQAIAKVIDERLTEHDKAKQLDAMTELITSEFQKTVADLGQWCTTNGFTKDQMLAAAQDPIVLAIDPYQPGGYQRQASVVSLLLLGEAQKTENQRLVNLLERQASLLTQYKGKVESKVAGVSRPGAASIPTGQQMFPQTGQQKSEADLIAPDDPSVSA